jgi:3-oxoacyl-(acyl-carrier-protein) synthase
MILGEGAAVFCLDNNLEKGKVKIIGVGYGTEQIKHGADISIKGLCFQKSIKMATEGMKLDDIDVIVMHAPGTVKGDKAEYNAINAIFKNKTPALTSNKWKIGHALGASGGLSLEMAILMLENNHLIESPFYQNSSMPKNIKTIMVNAVGFGGNAVSIVISK